MRYVLLPLTPSSAPPNRASAPFRPPFFPPQAGGRLRPLRERAHQERLPPRDVSSNPAARYVGCRGSPPPKHQPHPQRRDRPLRPRVCARFPLPQGGLGGRAGQHLFRPAVGNLPQLLPLAGPPTTTSAAERQSTRAETATLGATRNGAGSNTFCRRR